MAPLRHGRVRGGSEPSPSPSNDAPDNAAPSTVPAELVGRSWSWITSSGGNVLTFTSAGQYTSDVLVDAHPGESCGIEYSTHYAGIATFSDDSLTLRSDVSTRTKRDTCAEKVLSEDRIDAQMTSYEWRLVDDGSGTKELVLVGADGFEAHYRADKV
ncbi:MAG: hypothetical protein K0S65_5712 [Labilithrix sp.]|nr:hypothetical protein [Labilithrix sp.]